MRSFLYDFYKAEVTKWLPQSGKLPSGYEMANEPKIEKRKEKREEKKKAKRERKQQQHFLKRKRRQVMSASNRTKTGYT